MRGQAETVPTVLGHPHPRPLPQAGEGDGDGRRGTTGVAVTRVPAPRGLASGEIARFVFDAWRGADYTIRIRVDRGAVETLASLIPSVDNDLYDLAGADGTIPFRATETGRYYVAVIDRGGAAGSEVTIDITSP